MSRSYRKPYSSCCGFNFSAKQDKQIAARGRRHKQNQYLRITDDLENILIPHKYECSHNDVWTWVRDGKQILRRPTRYEWADYCRIEQGRFSAWEWANDEVREERIRENIWPPEWYKTLTRK